MLSLPFWPHDGSLAASEKDEAWRLENEIGAQVGIVRPRGEVHQIVVNLPRAAAALHRARRLRGNWNLIVEEIGLRKNRTVLTESRTLRVDRSGNVLFDSIQQGMDDAYGCLMDGDCIALLRRTAWELQILSAAGSVRHRIDLSTLTRHLPNLVSWTPCNTFLIACQDHVYDTDLLEIDSLGRLLWFLPKKDAIGCATAAQLVDDELILVADEFGHVAMEIRRDGLSATRKVSFGAISTERGKDKLRR